ncbi:MAG: hypothetical protein ACI4Q4_09600 [Oscillospiraceae bacterium]
MKGKATITLCDADSGRVIKQLCEHNMVTNALKSILQPPKSAIIGGLDFSRSLSGFLPISNVLLGGILLHATSVNENAEDFMYKSKYRLVGHAGSAYSGDDTMRGTLNETESGATANGYRFVWDFGTDKANGIIRCISLTNRHFGNIGTNNASTDGTAVCDPINPASTTVGSAVSLGSYSGQLLGMFEKNILAFISLSSGVLTLTKMRIPDPENLLITDTTDGVVYEQRELDIPFTPANEKMFFADNDNKLVYFFASSLDTTQDTTTVRYFTVNPVTCAVSEEQSITVEGAGSVSAAALYNGRLYLYQNSTINVFSSDSTKLKTYDYKVTKFYARDGGMYALATVDGVKSLASLNASIPSCIRTNGQIPIPSDFIPLPYSMQTSGNVTNNANVVMHTTYLATINNLSEPIVKTGSQTLKITYDISDS